MFRQEAPSVGGRVSVRYRTESGVNEALGEVVGLDPLRVRRRDGREVTITEPVALRSLAPRTVRNSEIRRKEVELAEANPAPVQEWVEGWLARAGAADPRENTAVPLGPSAALAPLPLAKLQEFFDAHSLPVRLLVPERIGKAAEKHAARHPELWEVGPEEIVGDDHHRRRVLRLR